MKKILFILIFAIIAVIVVYGGLVIYGNVQVMQGDSYSIPKVEEAKYKIKIENTGNIFYSNSVEDNGRIIILGGFWELIGNDFEYRDKQLILDENNFGSILVIKR